MRDWSRADVTSQRAIQLLGEYLLTGNRVASRLSISLGRVESLIPLQGEFIEHLTIEEEERLDAFLFRFSSLAAIVQDHVGRAVLLAEEENLSEVSKKDQRLLLEKFGALDHKLGFATVAELRNRLAHSYPDDPEKQSEVMNLTFDKASDLLTGYNGLLNYASKFGVGTNLQEIEVPNINLRLQP